MHPQESGCLVSNSYSPVRSKSRSSRPHDFQADPQGDLGPEQGPFAGQFLDLADEMSRPEPWGCSPISALESLRILDSLAGEVESWEFLEWESGVSPEFPNSELDASLESLGEASTALALVLMRIQE